MRPLLLTFSGLRSYRDTTTIDFSNLDLFAVIGDTGAGKSTIIEALSLALYAKKSWTGGQAGLADMIADGLNTMRVELRFQAEDHEWVVTRARHRNASAPVDKLTSPSGGGPNVDGARQVTERVTELVGLDHDQFTRAVVLPQGRFDLLLRATERQRTEILSSILGLGDIAATRAEAERVRDTWNDRAVEMRTKRSALPADPLRQLADASAASAAARTRVDALTVARDAAVRLHRLASERRTELARITDALAALPAPPGDPVAELRATRDRAAELHAARGRATAAAASAEAVLVALDARIEEVRDGFATRDRMAAAREFLHASAQSIDKHVASLASLDEVLAAHLAAPPPTEVDAALVAAEVAAGRRVDAAAAGHGAAEQACRDASAAWMALIAAQAGLAAAGDVVEAAEPVATATASELVAAEAELLAIERRLAEAARAEREALVADAVASVAAGCRAGDDCPVCGRQLPEGFDPPHPADDAAVAAALRTAEADVIAGRSARDAAARAAYEAEHRLSAARADAQTAATAVERCTDTVAANGLDATADEPLVPFVASVQAATAELEAARDARLAAGQALAVATAGLAASRRAHDDRTASIEADLAADRMRVEQHEALIARLPERWRPALDQAAAEAVVARLDTALVTLDEIEGERDDTRRAVAAGQAEAQAIDGLLSREVTMPVTRIVTALDVRNAGLRAVAAGMALTGDDAVELAVLPDLGDLEATDEPAELGRLADRAAELTRRGAELAAAADRAAAALAAAHDAATTELSSVLRTAGMADLDALHAAVGRAGAEREAAAAALAGAEADAAAAERIDAVRAVLDPFVANLKVLAIALRDSNFVAHLVRARESELLAEATRRLKDITGGRFGFTSGFGVVNVTSGEVRTPDTLSGGERFQAALALALGLVEIASRGGGKLDAVFVDEGFGSLDANALDTALETLGKVAGGGKVVALISHLRPVAEYVDTVLHVTRDDVLGSRIDVLNSDEREQLLADDIRSGLTA